MEKKVSFTAHASRTIAIKSLYSKSWDTDALVTEGVTGFSALCLGYTKNRRNCIVI